MATVSAVPFEELTRLASEFVTSQEGMWDHTAWMDLLSRLQQNGIETSEDMQAKLGELLEAMKQYREAVSATEDIEKALSTMHNASVAFIKRQKGVWGHAEWEDFLNTMQQNTHAWSEGMEAYLGGVLESLKVFYKLPAAAAAKKSAPAPAAAPVSKSATAAPKKASPKPSSAKKSKPAGKKKTT